MNERKNIHQEYGISVDQDSFWMNNIVVCLYSRLFCTRGIFLLQVLYLKISK